MLKETAESAPKEEDEDEEAERHPVSQTTVSASIP